MSVYIINVTIHVFAALFWLGGMFFLAAVGAPQLYSVDLPAGVVPLEHGRAVVAGEPLLQ